VEDGADQAGEGLAHEDGHATAEGGEEVAVGPGDWGDEAFETEAAQVVGHAGLAVAVGLWIVKGADTVAQGAVGEACRSGNEAAERGEEGDGTRVAPAQGRGRLTVIVGGQDDLLDGAGGDGAVLGHAFEHQQAVVDVAADGAKVGEVANVATDAEIVGVVEGGLGRCRGCRE